jgi:hypothetical protein
MKLYMTGQEKSDLLIQVTTWAGSIVYELFWWIPGNNTTVNGVTIKQNQRIHLYFIYAYICMNVYKK